MTETGHAGTDVSVRDFGGTRVLRACCALVALLLIAAIVYGGAMVIENYAQIAV
jgi:hypothetical protein